MVMVIEKSEGPMAAYVISSIRVTDPVEYAKYRALSGPSVEQYGGRFLVRGGAYEVLEGDWDPQRVVVVAFDDAGQARRWWFSKEYAAAKAVRREAATANFILIEGA